MTRFLFSYVTLGLGLVSGTVITGRQTVNRTITSGVENGINTECKYCPYSLCPNKGKVEDGGFTLSCWTEGTRINGDTTWLRADIDFPSGRADPCYITQWDLIEYAGDYTKDLPYCGHIPEKLTKVPIETKYNAECNIYPSVQGDHIKMYKPEVDLTIVCGTPDGSDVIGNTRWYRTTSNCYVSDTAIHRFDDSLPLDPCGDIPFLETKMRDPDPKPTSTSASFPAPTDAVAIRKTKTKASPPSLAKRFLYITTVGEDYARCYEEPNNSSEVIKTYEWAKEVIPQCGTWGGDQRDTIWLLTTEWCYVNDTLMDPALIDSELRSQFFPHCEYFVDEE